MAMEEPDPEAGFIIRDVPVVYDVEKQQLSCQGKVAPLKPLADKIRLEVFTKGGRMTVESLEVFELQSAWPQSQN